MTPRWWITINMNLSLCLSLYLYTHTMLDMNECTCIRNIQCCTLLYDTLLLYTCCIYIYTHINIWKIYHRLYYVIIYIYVCMWYTWYLWNVSLCLCPGSQSGAAPPPGPPDGNSDKLRRETEKDRKMEKLRRWLKKQSRLSDHIDKDDVDSTYDVDSDDVDRST